MAKMPERIWADQGGYSQEPLPWAGAKEYARLDTVVPKAGHAEMVRARDAWKNTADLNAADYDKACDERDAALARIAELEAFLFSIKAEVSPYCDAGNLAVVRFDFDSCEKPWVFSSALAHLLWKWNPGLGDPRPVRPLEEATPPAPEVQP